MVIYFAFSGLGPLSGGLAFPTIMIAQGRVKKEGPMDFTCFWIVVTVFTMLIILEVIHHHRNI
jgi:hypothetical protein